MICWLFGKSKSKRGNKDMNLVIDINNPIILCYLNSFGVNTVLKLVVEKMISMSSNLSML